MTALKTRKAISPVIATVIIVAVAIAISIAVAGWLFGLWGGFAGGTPQITVTNPTGSAQNNYVQVYLINNGSGSDEILEIEMIYGNTVLRATTGDLTVYKLPGNNPYDPNNPPQTASTPPIIIEANSEQWIAITWDDNIFINAGVNPPSSGDQVIVKLYFKNSSIQQFPVTLGP